MTHVSDAVRIDDGELSETYDVVVVGFGGAGTAAAIEAHTRGKRVVILEKSAAGGGHTRESGGSIREIADVDGAKRALQSYSDSVTPSSVFAAFVDGIPGMLSWLREIGADLVKPPAWTRGYPGAWQQTLEGRDQDGGLGGRLRVAASDGRSGGEALWDVLYDAVMARSSAVVGPGGIDVLYETRAVRLLQDDGRVVGVEAERGDETVRYGAGAVILTTGGFAADPDLQRDTYGFSMAPMGRPDGNTGDGIRMAQQCGAGLWHMTAVATVMGYELDGVGQAMQHQMAVPNYIYVDDDARRFIDETGYDWHALPDEFLAIDYARATRPYMPAWVIFDETARLAGPIINATIRAGRSIGWSVDNSEEVERGWIVSGATPEELAQRIGLAPDALAQTIDEYNRACTEGADATLGRTDPAPLGNAPYYAIRTVPILCNTQGGPRRDAQARVLDAFGTPIPGLFAAGELGSIWGKHYPGAGNVTEALVFGLIAGREAASETTEGVEK